jgi:hypothetical protein
VTASAPGSAANPGRSGVLDVGPGAMMSDYLSLRFGAFIQEFIGEAKAFFRAAASGGLAERMGWCYYT